jgi:hypothetical protein
MNPDAFMQTWLFPLLNIVILFLLETGAHPAEPLRQFSKSFTQAIVLITKLK